MVNANFQLIYSLKINIMNKGEVIGGFDYKYNL